MAIIHGMIKRFFMPYLASLNALLPDRVKTIITDFLTPCSTKSMFGGGALEAKMADFGFS